MYLNKDKETEWLNRMAADGWAMRRFFAGFYGFEKCEAGEYIYQVDFVDRLFSVSRDYRELMQDAGIEIVQTWGYWVIRKMFKIVTIIEMLIMFYELYMGVTYGAAPGYAAALLFAAILLGLVNMLFRLNNVIADLEEKQTGIAKKYRGRNVSAFLMVGLLLNSCSLMLMDVLPHLVTRTIQILAIVLMLAGLVQTGLGKGKKL